MSPTNVSNLLPPRTSTNSTLRTVTPTTVTPSDNSATTHKPPLTSPSITSNSQNTTLHLTHGTDITAPPASTSPKANNTNQDQTSPPISVNRSTAATTLAPPPPQQCSYSVTPIKFGLLVDMLNSTNASSSISLKEKGQPGQPGQPLLQSFKQSSHEINHLKPCTEYELNVTFIDSAGKESSCTTDIMTLEMSQDEVKDGSCMPGYVCYQSDWDISSSLSTSDNISAEQCKSDIREFCIKPGFNDICTNVTSTFTSGKCLMSVLFPFFSTDFLDPSEINQIRSNTFPAKIETELPPNCNNLTIDYTCQKPDEPNTWKLSELEPFTDYNCTGQIKDNNVTVNHTTVLFRIDCDLTIGIPNKTVTNTSIELSWDTTSKKCGPVLPDLKKLSYDCTCSPSQKHSISLTEQVLELKEHFLFFFTLLVPEEITSLAVNVPEHNVIKVTCAYRKSSFGPEKKFVAYLNGVKMFDKEKCDFEFKDLSYSTNYAVEVCIRFHKIITPVFIDNDKAVIGLLVFLIILTSVALLLVVYKIYVLRRRNNTFRLASRCFFFLPAVVDDEENLMPVEPIAADFLLEAYKRKLADEGRLFLAEFQSIPRIFSRYSVKEAKKSCNVSKNRYVDILPYDYNRVQLTTGNGEAGCEYINASSIDGYKESKKYIAAQGPKDETVSDFWRMVWEQQSSIIVMVTRCEEGNRIKCAQYWPSPERETEIFEEFIVKLNSEDHCPDYTIRHLSLTNKREKNSEREVTHIQFMSWPDHGVPGEPHLLLKLRRRVNAFKNFFSGPIVVHCSAGVGRTGTYIGIDAMMEGLEAEGRVDIYGYIVRLRRQRCLMVQVEAQYILIHQALLEHNQFGETEITVSELHSTLSTLKQRNSGNEPTLMEDEFERLPIYKNWRTFNTGITEENKKKNRSSTVIPYDYNRVLLKLDEGRSHDSDPSEEDEEDSSDEENEESTMYINASHIDGYWGPCTFLAAQTPLPDTMADFWSMVYQKRASTIVMLSDCSEGDKESDCVYWGKDKKTFGDFEVELASTDTSPTFISRNMLIRHVKVTQHRPVKQFQLLKWASGELPEKAQDLTDMIKDIKHSCGGSKSEKSLPIVVHCSDGSSRSGIFCALWNLLDSAETEKLVDVFQVVKTLRKERQGMLSNPEQYQFLYEALEGVFPVQNGEVKSIQASAGDSVQVVNETKAAEQPASTTTKNQQGAAESAPLVADGGKEDNKEEPESESALLEDTSTVTVEV
uniref:Receptor-type tyrosine-protein phosphatase C n=1 Tax=Cyclopterus lumpus TaxID=8103 RepID=A0A8C3AVG1_CYCLU